MPIPQIEIDFKNIQFAVNQWGVDNRVSLVWSRKRKASRFPSSWRYRIFFLFSWIIDSLQIPHARSWCRYCQTRTAQSPHKLSRSTRPFHTMMMFLFKTHVWGIVESQTPTIYHAATTTLSPIDRIKESFVRLIGVDVLSRNSSSLW